MSKIKTLLRFSWKSFLFCFWLSIICIGVHGLGKVEDIVIDTAVYAYNRTVSKAEALMQEQGWQPPEPSVDECIAKAADKHKVHEAQIRAMIEAESNWNPEAVSHVGAKGLMQIMDATAKAYNYKPSEMFSPCKNVDAGARRMAESFRYAYQEFNGGPKCIGKCKESINHARKVMLALGN